MEEKAEPHWFIRANRGPLPSYPLPLAPSATLGLESGQILTSPSTFLIRTQQFYLMSPTESLLFVPTPGRRWKRSPHCTPTPRF